MPLLVGHREKGHIQSGRQCSPMPLSRQEARHVGALHCTGTGTCAHSGQLMEQVLPVELLKKMRQPLHMLEEGVALPQAQGAGRHIKKAPDVLP